MNARGCIQVTGLLVVSAGLFSFIYAAVPEFRSLFSGFGSDLPALTNFVIATYKYYLLLPLLVVIPHAVRLYGRSVPLVSGPVLKGFAMRTFVVSLALTILCILAMYAPIIRMGPVV